MKENSIFTTFWLDSHLFVGSILNKINLSASFMSSVTYAGMFLSCALIDHKFHTCVLPRIRSETCVWWCLSCSWILQIWTRQTPPQTSLTSNTWKDSNVECVVNQGTTQEPARKSNWADKKTHSNLFCLKLDRQKMYESSQKKVWK